MTDAKEGMLTPTAYQDLNSVLSRLVTSVRAILGANLCGAYLQGSFAVGDADIHSDVDFLVVTNGEVTEAQRAELQEMHQGIYALDIPWAQHLEGSYVPRNSLRKVDLTRRDYLYLDNGATELVMSDHCNTAVVRWSLREHGIVLAGPDPKTLVDPVPVKQLRDEALRVIPEYADWARESQERFEIPGTSRAGMSKWKQNYLVLTFCRILHTLSEGTVGSKKQAGEWAIKALGAEWSDLIQRALDDRPDPWKRVNMRTEAMDRTLDFVEYSLRVAEDWGFHVPKGSPTGSSAPEE